MTQDFWTLDKMAQSYLRGRNVLSFLSPNVLYVDAENCEALKEGQIAAVFVANWCGPCRTYRTAFQEVAEARNDVRFTLVDTDASRELADAYQITSIPTTFLLQDGKPRAAIVGFRAANDLDKLITEAFS